MSKALLWLNTGGFRVVEPEKAVLYWQMLNGHIEPTEEYADKLPHIRDIFIPPSYRDQAKGYLAAHRHAAPSGIVPSGYDAEKAVTEAVQTSDAYHPGIEQGVAQGLPVNDR